MTHSRSSIAAQSASRSSISPSQAGIFFSAAVCFSQEHGRVYGLLAVDDGCEDMAPKRRPAVVGLRRASWTGWERLYSLRLGSQDDATAVSANFFRLSNCRRIITRSPGGRTTRIMRPIAPWG